MVSFHFPSEKAAILGAVVGHVLLARCSQHFDINNISVAQKMKKLGIGPFHLELLHSAI